MLWISGPNDIKSSADLGHWVVYICSILFFSTATFVSIRGRVSCSDGGDS